MQRHQYNLNLFRKKMDNMLMWEIIENVVERITVLVYIQRGAYLQKIGEIKKYTLCTNKNNLPLKRKDETNRNDNTYLIK